MNRDQGPPLPPPVSRQEQLKTHVPSSASATSEHVCDTQPVQLPLKRLYSCSFAGCKKSFRTINGLRRHERLTSKHNSCIPKDSSTTVSISLHRCKNINCEKVFTDAVELEQHASSCEQHLAYRCPQGGCEQLFATMKLLRTHVIDTLDHPLTELECMLVWMEQTMKPYACSHPSCNKRFGSPELCSEHARTCIHMTSYVESDIRSDKHEDAPSNVTNPERLSFTGVDEPMVTDEVPLTSITHVGCPHADTASNMKASDVTSTDDKAFTCPYPDCRKKCRTQRGIKMHITRSHIEKVLQPRKPEKLIQCEIDGCDMTFATMVGLKIHTTRLHASRPATSGNASPQVLSISCSIKGCCRLFSTQLGYNVHTAYAHAEKGQTSQSSVEGNTDSCYNNKNENDKVIETQRTETDNIECLKVKDAQISDAPIMDETLTESTNTVFGEGQASLSVNTNPIPQSSTGGAHPLYEHDVIMID